MAECKCSMRIKLVGDGCSICNPEYWKEILEELEEEDIEHTTTEGENR